MHGNRYWKNKFLPRGGQYLKTNIAAKEWIHDEVKRDGGKIALSFWEAKQDSKRVVILMHPYRNEAKDYFFSSPHASMYHEMGYHVVVFDVNGFGESDDLDFRFDHDIFVVSQYCMARWNPNILAGHGISFGGAILINGLVRNDHHFTKAIIENCLDHASNYYRKRNPSLYILSLFIFRLVPQAHRFFTYYKRIREVKRPDPVLLLYCNDDDLTTIKMGQRLKENLKVGGEFFILNGGHMEAVLKDAEKYREIIKNYLNC
ncbi:MAG TPA: hypothetical protein PKC30_11320 [Saprospiraceae bacterium]|nr:hypothetical protein [Saprospiraceae bacterium]